MYACSRRLSSAITNDFFLSREADSFNILHITSMGWGTNNCVFVPVRLELTLSAMATYIFHRLTMGNVIIYIFFCHNANCWIFFYRNYYGVVLYVS